MKHDSFVADLTAILHKNTVIKLGEAESLAKAFKNSEQAYFDDFLLQEGIVGKDDLLEALAEYYQVPFFDVAGYFFDHSLVHMFPKDVMLRNGFIPIEQDENMLIVAVSDPSKQNLLPIMGRYVSYDIHFRVGIRTDIIDAVEEYYDRSLTDLEDEDDDDDRMARMRDRRNEQDLEELAYDDFEKDE